jgi:hypothetical protein
MRGQGGAPRTVITSHVKPALTGGPVIVPVPFLSRKEAAARLRVSVATIKRLEAAGLLDARRPSPGVVRITAASVEARARAKRKDAA